MSLTDYGYDEYFREEFEKNYAAPLQPARVIAQHRGGYVVAAACGEIPATLSGKYRYTLDDNIAAPVAGDFAAAQLSQEGDRAVILGLLPRRTCFFRSDSWHVSGAQVLGANFDTVFLCMSLNQNFNLARLERYLIMAKESRAEIAVVLTKADLCRDAEIKAALCEAACHVPVYTVSALTGQGMEALRPCFAKGKTVAALGSSGVGKSTIVNALFGREIMKTAEARGDDDRGRHTTVHRQIILLPSGGLYMDTPGLREIGLTQAEDAVSEVFSDIGELISQCRFSDCTHQSEPGCAVRAAIENGALPQRRWEHYLQYKKEASYFEDKKGYVRDRSAFFKNVAKQQKNKKKLEKFQ